MLCGTTLQTPLSCRSSIPPKPEFLRNFWLTKAKNLFPYLVVAVGKLLSAHATAFAANCN